jgi:sialate O-acetylesterase
MKPIQSILLLIISFIVLSINANATNWVRLARLDGLWNFSVGDNMQWANPSIDVSDWDKLYVPGRWENHYEGYNGYGWYRKNFNINWIPDEGELVLMLGYIDDVDEVFVNGVKVGHSGSYFPNFETAHNIERNYHISRELLKAENNTIAVRVYDTGGPGGIVSGNNIGLYYNSDIELLSMDLSGEWKFSIARQRGLTEPDFDDSHWNSIRVPGKWENQGYPDHDGYAWYRTRFTVPTELFGQELYLVLGKIDDFDKVYLNGDLIGRTEYLDDFTRFRKSTAWQLYRVYKIPQSKLMNENVLVVEVRDDQIDGGIYEGPVGLISKQNANLIEERNRPDFWSDPIRAIMRYF